MRRLVLRAFVCLALLVAAAPVSAATFDVTSTADATDALPGDGLCASAANGCTLRAAVQEADALAGADVINVPAGTYTFAITGRGEDAGAAGDLDVTDDLTINGAGARAVTIDAHGVDRAFDVPAPISLAIRHLTLQGGSASGGPTSDNTGGAVRSVAGSSVELTNVRVRDGAAAGGGTATASAGTLKLVATSVTSYLETSSILSSGALSLINTTVNAGAVKQTGGTADIVNSTLVSDGSQPAPALDLYGGSLRVTNSLLGAPGASACTGSVAPQSGGHNLVTDGSCALSASGDVVAADLGLRQLDTKSAETDVLPLWAWGTSYDPPPNMSCDPSLCPRLSRAVNAGDAAACPANDQIGTARPQGGGCDIGAYEAPEVDLALSVTTSASEIEQAKPLTLTWTITNLGQANVDNLLMTLKLPLTSSTLAQDLVGPNDGCTMGSGGSICDMKTGLAAGASLTRTMTVQLNASQPTPVTYAGIVEADATDGRAPYEPNQLNNTAGVSIAVKSPPPVLSPSSPSDGGHCARIFPGATARADKLRGTASSDLLDGGRGNDQLRGLAGDDCLFGRQGNDLLDGGAGADRLDGGSGRDRLIGGAGNDLIIAADHQRDSIDCGRGRDRAVVDRIDRVKGCERLTRNR